MSVWLIRHGKRGIGEYQEAGFKNSRVNISYSDVGIEDISLINSHHDLLNEFEKKKPHPKQQFFSKFANELWWFKNDIRVNDLVIVPLKDSKKIAIAKIEGGYKYLSNEKLHTRKCKWLCIETERNQIARSLWKGVNLYYTVFRFEQKKVETRLSTILKKLSVQPNLIHKTTSINNEVSLESENEQEYEVNLIEDGYMKGNEKITVKQIIIKRYHEVVKKLKSKYDSKCQICSFTFKKSDESNYSEAHHLIPLSKGGTQNEENVVILCSNHHRMMHYAETKVETKNGRKRNIFINGIQHELNYKY